MLSDLEVDAHRFGSPDGPRLTNLDEAVTERVVRRPGLSPEHSQEVRPIRSRSAGLYRMTGTAFPEHWFTLNRIVGREGFTCNIPAHLTVIPGTLDGESCRT